MRDHLFSLNKINYIKGDKPRVGCILCAINERNPLVENLEIIRTDNFILSLNLYPYNPGHVMIFPARHRVDFQDLSDTEALEMHRLMVKSISILKEEFTPSGFNIGFNLGCGSGASIDHIHQHVVPRYGNESGFMDVLSGTRIIVIDPREVLERMRKRFIRNP
jgi:ATP adenylyltransferase